AIAQAVLSRLRLRLEGEFIAGEYSPQYLFHCRGRWLLDAWHHGAEARRTIALEEIAAAGLLDKPAVDIEEDEPPFACLF
ncbi:MAG TPA: transcriptional regulator, partial [Plasticicumulans sp.]|nr:transcriptional regulator [Plasticicumulans sp.]